MERQERAWKHVTASYIIRYCLMKIYETYEIYETHRTEATLISKTAKRKWRQVWDVN
jgi:hypothetical protein